MQSSFFWSCYAPLHLLKCMCFHSFLQNRHLVLFAVFWELYEGNSFSYILVINYTSLYFLNLFTYQKNRNKAGSKYLQQVTLFSFLGWFTFPTKVTKNSRIGWLNGKFFINQQQKGNQNHLWTEIVYVSTLVGSKTNR